MGKRTNPDDKREPDLFSYAAKQPAESGPMQRDTQTSAAIQSEPAVKKPAEPAVLTVGELTRTIKGQLAGLGKLAVEGEVTQVRIPASGHVYFSLKDEKAVLSCAIWRSKVSHALPFELKEGTRVVVYGSLDVYAPRGGYSLIVDRVEQRGIGALLAQLEALKADLREKGWFDRARPLPNLPQRIGVVTSRDTAAFQDFLRTRTLRWAGYPVRLAHAAVQGQDAADEVAAAIERLDQSGVDVIVVCRGGGSLEDLWCFNELPVARAIHACSVPVVSGVGHEVDVTLADFVADHRAHTPTDAAVLVIPERAAYEEELDRQFGYLVDAMEVSLQDRVERLERAGRSRVLRDANWMLADRAEALGRVGVALKRAVRSVHDRLGSLLASTGHRLASQSPALRLERQRSRLDQGIARLDRAWQRSLEMRENRLRVVERSLGAVSPLAVLERGYSVTLKGGKPVRDAANLNSGEQLVTRLHRGEVASTVTDTNSEESV